MLCNPDPRILNSLSPSQPGTSAHASLSDETPDSQLSVSLTGLCSSVPGGFWRMLESSEKQERPHLPLCCCVLSPLSGEEEGMVACLRKVEDCTHCLLEGPCLPLCVCQMTALASQVLVILEKGKLMDTGTDSVCLSGEILDAARNSSHSFWKSSGLRPLPSPLPLTGSTGPFGSRCSLAVVFRGIRCVALGLK